VKISIVATICIVTITITLVVTSEIVTTTIFVCWGYVNETFCWGNEVLLFVKFLEDTLSQSHASRMTVVGMYITILLLKSGWWTLIFRKKGSQYFFFWCTLSWRFLFRVKSWLLFTILSPPVRNRARKKTLTFWSRCTYIPYLPSRYFWQTLKQRYYS